MSTSRSRPATPDQRVRELRKEFRALDAEQPSAERSTRLAEFTRAATVERQLNLAMQTAERCLEDDPEPPQLLLAAFDRADQDTQTRLDALADLRDLAGYLGREDVVATVEVHLTERAREWTADADASERRYRLRTIQSLVSAEVADLLRDEFTSEP